ncbi:hypothetical protein F2P81_024382 [Scophthalmus maximus]|uniref:Uncharacterized protein n=1 Tax=Scophthalmus maximus TaxID=52904 RepID=A0A6A4RXB4_SCOMX|nr:hypothetical protein F2P81_024382 [Scophthalmus maximus]
MADDTCRRSSVSSRLIESDRDTGHRPTDRQRDAVIDEARARCPVTRSVIVSRAAGGGRNCGVHELICARREKVRVRRHVALSSLVSPPPPLLLLPFWRMER